ncbi:hypothetical protein PtrSN002B_008424 [Pyrenophora tritici-repentis]|nr:hypothetical protein A1F99_112020 [Pyrenophora tritici-repentis]KAI0576658.1 hypothetical protein Alg130_08693 [Pyrenophora tritici-repentis]KAI0580334.1 hypothetical protein Alg215_05264 [Pyrenophora tritici-repentis]KAI0612573.1 hypothetical protein TUN205_03159 [Pyrenophora tritici-repentis]KAI0624336.1 hypothetical protein TUN199_03645 [Pyrenophora tritici-repentis]
MPSASLQQTDDRHYSAAMALSMLKQDQYGPPVQAWNSQQAQLEGNRPQSITSNNIRSRALPYPCVQSWNNFDFGSSHMWDRDQDGLSRSPYILSDPESASQFHQNQELMYDNMATQNVAVKDFSSWVPKTPNGLLSGVNINAVTSVSPTSHLSDDFENTYSPGSLLEQTSPVTNWQGYSQSVQTELYDALETENPANEEFNGHAIPMAHAPTQYQHGPQSSSAYSFTQDGTSGCAPWYQPNHPYALPMPSFGARNADSYNTHSTSNTSSPSAKDNQSIQSHQATSYMTLPTENQSRVYSQVPFSEAGVQSSSYMTLPGQDMPQVQSKVPFSAAGAQRTSHATLPMLFDSHVSTNAASSQMQNRVHNDKLLLEGKKNGLTYNQISRQWLGPPPEMSTLRGRYRALIKPKNQRVRKPNWTQNDCDLLNMIVQQEFDRIDDQTSYSFDVLQKLTKVAWKKVADYIRTHGGSYLFGNSTCKKKWEDLHGIKRKERAKKTRKMASN